jgi:drug/metabolite transporter (DMT)-like permease
MGGALWALLAALAYGTGDFVGGLGGRRTRSAPAMSVVIQATGVLVATVATLGWLLLGLGGAPSGAVLAWGAASGLGSGTGNAALYRGLARGEMAVVAPTSAVVTVLVPAGVGLATGDRLSPAAWCGVLLSLPAVMLTSWTGRSRGFSSRDVGYGVVAGIGFGWLFVALDRAGTGAGPWPLVPGQLVAVLLVLAVSRSGLRRDRPPWGRVLRWAGSSGLLAGAANQLFLASTAAGSLTVSAVLAALYPAVTVALAMVLLGEPAGRSRWVGLVLSAASVVLVVSGT